MGHASTHVLFSTGDLRVLERRLGRNHPITTRARFALAELDDPDFARYRATALRLQRSGELEIDPNAVVSKGSDPGSYVMAWLWIEDEHSLGATATPGGAR